MYLKELELAKKLAVEAGEKILEIYSSDFSVEYKDDDSPLTQADLKANEIIEKGLTKEFPNYAFLSEESKVDFSRMKEEYCWIVDPLDGTKEFVNRNGEFTVNIALSRNGKSVLGVVYVPVSEELFFAYEGYGAAFEYKGKVKKIQTSKKIDELVLVSSKSHKSEKFLELIKNNEEKISEVKSAGSSLKGCLVALGEVDAYYRFGLTCEWDTAAMHIIVEEAGGEVKQIDGTELRYNRKNTLNEKGFYMINNKNSKLTF